MDYEFREVQRNDVETPDFTRIEQTSEISIDNIADKLNNQDDVVEYEDLIETPRDETPQPKEQISHMLSVYKRYNKYLRLSRKFDSKRPKKSDSEMNY